MPACYKNSGLWIKFSNKKYLDIVSEVQETQVATDVKVKFERFKYLEYTFN
jgi:hypothetical protein